MEAAIGVPTTQQIADRFNERSDPNLPSIDALTYLAEPPASVRQKLYDRIDTCPEWELPMIQRVVVNSGLTTQAYIAAHLAAFDLTVDAILARSDKGTPETVGHDASRIIMGSFRALGLENIDGGELSDDRADLLCAHILASAANILADDFIIKHEYHVEVERLRSNMDLLRSSAGTFLSVRESMPHYTSVKDSVAVVRYIQQVGAEHTDRIISMISERGSFDRDLADMIINSPTPAIAEGTL